MPITRTTMIDDDGSGTTGTIINNAWKQQFYDQIDAFADGVWIDIPFNAANYTVAVGSGTWTVASGNQLTLARVTLNQKTLLVTFHVNGTATTGSVQVLGVTIPGITNTRRLNGTFNWYGSSGSGVGMLDITGGSNVIRLQRDYGGTPWTATTGFFLAGQIVLSV